MEPTADIDLGPQESNRERVEQLLTFGVMIFVFMVFAAMISACVVT
jgi:hypothetical protein